MAEVKEKWDSVMEEEIAEQDRMLLVARGEIAKKFESSVTHLNSELEVEFNAKKEAEMAKVKQSEYYLQSLREDIEQTEIAIKRTSEEINIKLEEVRGFIF